LRQWEQIAWLRKIKDKNFTGIRFHNSIQNKNNKQNIPHFVSKTSFVTSFDFVANKPKIIKTICLAIFTIMFALMTKVLMLKNDRWLHLCLACEINGCFILLRFHKLSFGSISTPTYAPYLKHAIKDRNLGFQNIFQISMDSRMCKIHRLCSWNKNKNRKYGKRLCWMKNSQRINNKLHPTPLLVTPKYIEHWTNDEIECLQPSKCPFTFKSI